jgi:amino acid adenylation domain-containing protein
LSEKHMNNTKFLIDVNWPELYESKEPEVFVVSLYFIFSRTFTLDSSECTVQKVKCEKDREYFSFHLNNIPEEIRFSELLQIVHDKLTHSGLLSSPPASNFQEALKTSNNSYHTCIVNMESELQLTFLENEFGCIINKQNDVFEFQIKTSPNNIISFDIPAFFNHINTQCSLYPDTLINEMLLVSEEEQQQLLNIGRGQNISSNEQLHFLDLFQKAEDTYNKQTAVIWQDLKLTYGELAIRSDELAFLLQQHGATKNSRIGICLDRSFLISVSLLAVMKTGGAFVPVDPNLPAERINFILKDSGIDILITDQSLGINSIVTNENMVIIDPSVKPVHGLNIRFPQIFADPSSPAYIIYTSGSTGQPKGVVVTHSALANLLVFLKQETGISQGHKMMATTSVSFDISYCELLMPLIAGAQVIIIDHSVMQRSSSIAEAVYTYQPDLLQLTPAGWQMLLESYPDNRGKLSFKILCGGESLTKELAHKLLQITTSRKENPCVWNLYGPTETTIYSTYKRITEFDCETITIGRPISNTQCFIVDKKLRLLPAGAVGELVIAGSGVATGYLNRPELTAEKFVSADFLSGNSIVYRTGDYARWLNGDEIMLHGRLDDQVKIRGYRIELGEIDFAVRAIPEISGSCVVVRENELTDKKLVLYFSATPDYLFSQAVKSINRQIESWQNIYENQYAEPLVRVKDEEVDITIWNDSFTGNKISVSHIREWLDEIISVIMSGSTEDVLELGCGTGLVYKKLAGQIRKYTGSDFSASGVRMIQELALSAPGYYPETFLQVCPAHLTEVGQYPVDTVVINSVIQYFPSEEYLVNVIEKAISAVQGPARIIIGDVRDLRLLEAFKMRYCFLRMPGETGIKEFQWAVAQEVFKDEQLSVSPSFFYDLRHQFSSVSHVEILHKDVSLINEMSLYRYNVVLYINTPVQLINAPVYEWINPERAVALAAAELPAFVVKNIPNPKLLPEQKIAKLINDAEVKVLQDLRGLITISEEDNSEQRSFISLLKAQGYKVKLYTGTDPYSFHLSAQKESGFIYSGDYTDEYTGRKVHTNIPYEFQVYAELQELIRNSMQKRLPAYMIPDTIIPVQKIPLTYNGKTDRKFLATLEVSQQRKKQGNAPVSTGVLGAQLLDIWKSVLYLDDIHPDENFFVIGGHSLTATRVISAIRKKLNFNIQISDLFKYPTVNELQTFLSSLKKDTPTNNQVSLDEAIQSNSYKRAPLSFFQDYVMTKVQSGDVARLHIAFRLWFKGDLKPAVLEKAFQEVINRHQILRSVVVCEEKIYGQECLLAGSWKMNQVEIPSGSDAIDLFIQDFIYSSFDVTKDHLIRAVLIKRSITESELVFVLHPLAADGWSISILLNEVMFFYNLECTAHSGRLPELPVQYKDYAIWQKRHLSGDILDAKTAFWKRLVGNGSSLKLPYDYECFAGNERKGEWIRFSIDEELWEQTCTYAFSQNVTPYMVLLTAFCRQLRPYCNDNFISIGTAVANRDWEELEPLIGYFANTLPLFLDVKKDETFQENVQAIKSQMLDIYANQDFPINLINSLVPGVNGEPAQPLFHVTFEYNSMPPIPISLELKGLETTISEIVQPYMERDLRYCFTIIENKCYVGIKYCKNCFKETTVRQFVDEYMTILNEFISSPFVLANNKNMQP